VEHNQWTHLNLVSVQLVDYLLVAVYC